MYLGQRRNGQKIGKSSKNAPATVKKTVKELARGLVKLESGYVRVKAGC